MDGVADRSGQGDHHPICTICLLNSKSVRSSGLSLVRENAKKEFIPCLFSKNSTILAGKLGIFGQWCSFSSLSCCEGTDKEDDDPFSSSLANGGRAATPPISSSFSS